MAKSTKKSTNTKKASTSCGPAFNMGKPVVYMVVAIITCLCLSLGGFMIGYNVGARDTLSAVEAAESEDAEATDTTNTGSEVNQ